MNVNTEKHMAKEPTTKSYVFIWLLLMVCTGLTVTTAGLNLGGIAIIVCLAIAAFKSMLVLLYFMHLRYEEKKLIKLIMPIAVAALAIFIGLTYTDVIFR